MVHVEFELDDLDYESLIERLLPELRDSLKQSKNPVALLLSNGMPAALAKTVVRKLSQAEKDKLAVDIISQFSTKLEKSADDLAAKNNVKVKVKNLKAHT